jgi:hypothetical protein
VWKIKKREFSSGSCYPLIGSSLFLELSRADKYQRTRAQTRTQSKKARQDKHVRGVLRLAAVKTTWVESLGQDRSVTFGSPGFFNQDRQDRHKSHITHFRHSCFLIYWPIIILVVNYMSNNISWTFSLRWI